MNELKEMNVAQGILTFANALIGQHYANKVEVLTIVIEEMRKELSIISSSDSERNK